MPARGAQWAFGPPDNWWEVPFKHQGGCLLAPQPRGAPSLQGSSFPLSWWESSVLGSHVSPQRGYHSGFPPPELESTAGPRAPASGPHFPF